MKLTLHFFVHSLFVYLWEYLFTDSVFFLPEKVWECKLENRKLSIFENKKKMTLAPHIFRGELNILKWCCWILQRRKKIEPHGIRLHCNRKDGTCTAFFVHITDFIGLVAYTILVWNIHAYLQMAIRSKLR